MKTLIMRILSIILKIVGKILSDEELTKLIEKVIRADLDGDGFIGDEKETSDDVNFQIKAKDNPNADNPTNMSNSIDNNNNTNDVQNNLSVTLPNTQGRVKSNDVRMITGGKLL
jgi:hypothetical protein